MRPSSISRPEGVNLACVCGRENPHVHDQSPSSPKVIRPPHAGQPVESSCHSTPAATKSTVGPAAVVGSFAPVAQTTSGSSALATTVTSRIGDIASRQRCATMRTSLTRSSWSRDKLSSTSTSADTATATLPR